MARAPRWRCDHGCQAERVAAGDELGGRHPADPAAAARPPPRPDALYGDRQYGTPRNQQGLKERRIEDHLARQRTPHGSGLGKVRWVVESTLSWVGQARRLKIRYEKLPAIHRAFHYLQLARICCKIPPEGFLKRFRSA